MFVAASNLVGRDEELEAVLGVLETVDGLPGVAVLSGDAGIGKTSLWLAGVGAAAQGGYRVVTSRPSEAETTFSFAGLTDLLGGLAGDVLPELPPVQRHALEAALLLGDPGLRADDRAVAAALLGALRVLAGDGPLCVGVDDIQWLDGASLAALRYAIHRLDGEPVAALLAVRGPAPAWLRQAVPEERLRVVEVGGLSVGATHELLHNRLDAAFPRPTLLRLWETSQGNPLFALELAAALQRRGGALGPGEELPIPSDLDELLRSRLDGLVPEALEVARAVAALADPTVALVETALGARFEQGLADALEARILEVDGGRLRFTHPLLGTAVAARQTPARRRELNARLADVVPTAEERARHLALATTEPDAAVAAILDDAAKAAHVRGAWATAAELAEQALRLTPAAQTDDVRHRRLAAANLHGLVGDDDRAVALLEQARAEAARGRELAMVLSRLAGLQRLPQDAVRVYREALAEAEADDALQVEIHVELAGLMRFTEGLERGVAHGELAMRAAEQPGDPRLRCRALAAYGLTHFAAGRGIPRAEVEQALVLERSLPEWPLDDGPTHVHGHQLWWSGDVDGARSLFEELLDVRRARNLPAAESETLWFLGFLEWRAGNWERAYRYAVDSLELAAQLGRVTPPGELPAAVIAAHLGLIDEARARAEGAFGRAEDQRMLIAESGHGWVLGFVELSLGDAAAALPHLRRSYRLRDDFVREPGMRLELGDLLEALVAAGELDEAEEVLDTWEARAGRLDRAWALAIVARGRALLLAARGDLDGAFASFDRAVAEHARDADPFHRARTSLALGRTQRRAKRRAAARATLENAAAQFERLGAPLWAEQARAELARIGGRAPSRGELTEAERRIAELVAEGHTNREVATALFLAEHSVETALTRVYRKLGVRSRAELAHLLAANS